MLRRVHIGQVVTIAAVKALIVSFYFPPAGGGGVQRPLKLAQYLPAMDVETHVLAPDDPMGPLDNPIPLDKVIADDSFDLVERVPDGVGHPYGFLGRH